MEEIELLLIKRAKRAQYMRERRANNLEKCLLYERLQREKNKEIIKKRTEANIENIRLSKRKYQEKYRELYPENIKIWRENNKEHRKEYSTKYSANRRKVDKCFKFRQDIRNLINISFKNRNYIKSKKTEIILGCTIPEFIDYILKKCPKGITINDFKQFGYHLDHIIPVSAAETEEEIIKLCHYTNFQPLWWKDNIQKSNKIEWKH